MIYDWFTHIEFAYPSLLVLLGALPIVAFLYLYNSGKRQPAITVPTAKSFTLSSAKVRMRHLPFFFRLLAMACIILALARPQKKSDGQRTEGDGIDIVLCMDVSGSMASKDILPTRMEVAKATAEEFVRSRPVDRIGLVIFSGESFTQCPVTTDKNTLISQIETLESRKYLTDGTVIGEGLATAVDRLRESDAKSKVIILLTDGKEDPPKTRLIDPLTALEIAKSVGVKVYTIGMSGANPTDEEASNGEQSIKTQADYLDVALLQKIANETGGKYFRARDKDGLQLIYKQIDQLEKSKIEIISFQKSEEKFIPIVLAALFFLLIEFILRMTVFRRFP